MRPQLKIIIYVLEVSLSLALIALIENTEHVPGFHLSGQCFLKVCFFPGLMPLATKGELSIFS